ncbi:hypothetical protein POTOM_040450 [Populus tomentosa]|uniref:Regulator of chromosome condensation family protein n=1 Tax=Populus tomentosa TaxID=118781 RepID=A0A8X8CAA3_POPTO|nr:hypothetical protein POTOM_040450 [Populus tomentosa]
MMMLLHSCLVRQLLTLDRHFSSLSTASKVPVRALFLGRGASDQLVGGIEYIRLYPSPVTALLFRSFSNHWPSWDGGRLGFVHENPAFLPTPNPFMDSVHSIALGGIRAMAVSVHWGMYHRELFPRLVEGSWDGKTRHISTTGMHSSAITDSEGDGRLGLGPGQGPNEGGGLSILCKVKAFPVPVAAVSCDDFFRMVLAEEGQVWNWGGEDVDGYALKKDEIAGGGYHCLALTGKVTPERLDEGQVLSWGFDGHGQLGHSSIQCQKIPAVIDVLADQHVIHVTCGGSSLAAITGKSRHDLELHLWIGGSGMDTRSKARTLSGPVSDPSKLPKWNHDGSQFYCSAGTNARHELLLHFLS